MEYEAIENGETPLFFYEFTGEATFNCCREYVKQRLLRPIKANEFYSLRMIDIEAYNRNIDTKKKEYKREIKGTAVDKNKWEQIKAEFNNKEKKYEYINENEEMNV